jgi:hypothetical protein
MATTHIPDALQAAVSEFTNFLSSPLRAPADQYEVVESRFDCLKLLTQRLERSGFYRHDELKLFKEWFQAETDPWLLASSMVSRARLWPEGYPGDYLTLEMVYANVPTGDGVARHIDRYLLSRTLAVAVRSRCRRLTALLQHRAGDDPADAKWLNLACGSCRELLTLNVPAHGRRIYCVDSDPNSLDYAKNLLNHLHLGECHFIAENAYRFVNAKRTIERYGHFDVIYSAGLFDYLPSDKLSSLIRGLYDSLAPNGLIIAPFKDMNCYEAFDYHWFTKWHFFYQRNEADFRAVFSDAGIPPNAMSVERDETGVLLFFTIRK